MDIQTWATEIHANALAHGWHDEPRSVHAYADLFTSELSEALEQYRENRPLVSGDDVEEMRRTEDWEEIRRLHLKPEGIATELIDCVIRILDYAWLVWGREEGPAFWARFQGQPATSAGVDTEELIATAECEISKAWAWSHGGRLGPLCAENLQTCCQVIINWVWAQGIDPEKLMELKHDYNLTRPYRHGGKKL